MSTGASFYRHQHCFVDRSIVLTAEALFCHSLTGALFCWLEHRFVDRSLVMSTGAMLCRPEHSDRSMPQEHCGFGGSTVLSQSDRSIVVAVGALFCRQEHGFVDRSNAMSTGASVYRQEHAWGLGPACWPAGLGPGAGLGIAWPACNAENVVFCEVWEGLASRSGEFPTQEAPRQPKSSKTTQELQDDPSRPERSEAPYRNLSIDICIYMNM